MISRKCTHVVISDYMTFISVNSALDGAQRESVRNSLQCLLLTHVSKFHIKFKIDLKICIRVVMSDYVVIM